MSNLEYPACIKELYLSDVLGEQAFLALMAAAKNEREKSHFGTWPGLSIIGISASVRSLNGARQLSDCNRRVFPHTKDLTCQYFADGWYGRQSRPVTNQPCTKRVWFGTREK